MVLSSNTSYVAPPEKPFGLYLLEHIEAYGDALALVDPKTNLEVTFEELKAQSLIFARKLRALEIGKGDIVGLVVPFKPQFVSLVIGITLTKAAVTFCNINHKVTEILKQLQSLEPAMCIIDEETSNISVANLEQSLPSARKICTVKDLESSLSTDILPHIDMSFADIDLRNDPLFIYYTSGTTGEAKGVVFTNHAVVGMAESAKNTAGSVSRSVTMTVCAQLHSLSVGVTTLHLMNGSKHIIVPSLNPQVLKQYVKKYNINGIIITNAYCLSKIIDELDALDRTLQFVFITGVKFPPVLLEKARKKYGIIFASLWGTTETSGVCEFAIDAPVESAGKLFRGSSLKTVDVVTGDELGANCKGELCVKSPYLFKEYVKAGSEKMKSKDEDGWFHTGDLGYYDENGFVYVVDRIKDVIKSNCANAIFPSELEAVLMSHPGVGDAAVTRVNHPLYLEAPKAFVVKREPNLTKVELLEYFNEKVAKYKMLHGGLEFIDVIPRTGLGKPLKRILAQRE